MFTTTNVHINERVMEVMIKQSKAIEKQKAKKDKKERKKALLRWADL